MLPLGPVMVPVVVLWVSRKTVALDEAEACPEPVKAMLPVGALRNMFLLLSAVSRSAMEILPVMAKTLMPFICTVAPDATVMSP